MTLREETRTKAFQESSSVQESEKELRIHCARILREDFREESAEIESENGAHTAQLESADSKKQLVLGERVFHVARALFRLGFGFKL